MGRPIEALPVEAVRGRVLEAIARGGPVVVAAPTGSGKSTRIPVWLAGEDQSVLVVEPRRVACRALAQWVAEQRGEPVGETVGYRVRFEARSGPNTRILFVTPGMALTMLSGRDDVEHVSAVMLDEFHERSAEVDLLATLARQGRFGPDTRLLLCSATLDTEALVSKLDAELVCSQGRTFPVEVEPHGEGPPTTRDLEARVHEVTARLLDRTDGDVLVFLPGKREIERCRTALHNLPAELVAVHGGVAPRVLTNAFRPSASRRVFLATNVAETSLTIPSVTAVVDSGLVRMRVHQGGRAVLAIVPISAAQMQQRAGRAGRVGPGLCVQLWSPRFEPEPVTPPEVERIELDDVLLRAGLCGLQPRDIADAPWITALPDFALHQAMARLTEQGILDARGCLTGRGRAQAELPVSSLGARLLAEAPPGLVAVLADLVAIIEVGRDLLLPLSAVQRSDAVDEARGDLFEGALDEVDVQLRCLREGDPQRHGLHPSVTKEARRLATQLRRRTGAPSGEQGEPGQLDRLALVRHLLRRAPETAFVPRAGQTRACGPQRSVSRRWGNGEIELQLRDYAIPSIPPDRQPDPPQAALVLDWEWLGRGRGSTGVGRLMMRCRLTDLVGAGLGVLEVGRPTLSGSGRKRTVVASVRRTHAGVVLTENTEPLRGKALCDALADLVVRGAIHRDFGQGILDRLHQWDLLHQNLTLEGIEAGILPPPDDPTTHVAQRLRELGVEAEPDLALIEPEDLVQSWDDRAMAAGLAARAVQSLFDDFPRRFTVPGGHYACRVDLRRRVVVLEPADDKTKREPAARLIPRFRGFAVHFQKASRIVRLR